jgi:serine/threonine-protein phosphatase 2A regulatory subunit B
MSHQLLLPETEIVREGFEGIKRKEFKNCHQYNINSLSVSSDGETFMSADDLRINLWHLNNDVLAFNVVDLKPTVLDDLQEVITHMEHHPTRSDLFLFSSSKGYIATCDLRMNSRFDKKGKNVAIFMTEDEPSRKNFFTDIVNSVSKARFSPIHEDPYIFSRDYLAVHVWDIRNTKMPARTLNVTDYMEKKLCDVYESEAIFDKFDLHVSPDASMVLTGSYNSNAHVLDLVN